MEILPKCVNSLSAARLALDGHQFFLTLILTLNRPLARCWDLRLQQSIGN